MRTFQEPSRTLHAVGPYDQFQPYLTSSESSPITDSAKNEIILLMEVPSMIIWFCWFCSKIGIVSWFQKMIENHLISCLFQIIHITLFLAIFVCSLLISEFLFPRNTSSASSHQDLYSGSIPTDSIQLTYKRQWEMLSISLFLSQTASLNSGCRCLGRFGFYLAPEALTVPSG